MKRFRRKHSAGPAFTLIELLVVVAIIALLISILLPSLAKAREQTRRVKCGTQINQVLLASHTYMTQNSGWFVHPQLFPQQVSGEKWIFDGAQPPLAPERTLSGGEASGVWDCPNNVKAALRKKWSWEDPSHQGWDARYAFVSIGANDWGVGEASMSCDNRDTTGLLWFAPNCQVWSARDSMVRQTASFISFGESNRDTSWDQLAVQDLQDWCATGEVTGAVHPVNATFGMNTGFFDGHVVWMPTWRKYNITLSLRVPDGVMQSDWVSGGAIPGGLTPQERSKWRVMWSRDYKPHIGDAAIPNDYVVSN